MTRSEKFISDADLANQTLGVLRQFDVDIQGTRLEMVGRGKAADDPMPEIEETYGERLASLERRKAAIVTDNEDIMAEVRALRDESERAQAAQRLNAMMQAGAVERQAAASGQSGDGVTADDPQPPAPETPPTRVVNRTS